jgi:hypothetical protein
LPVNWAYAQINKENTMKKIILICLLFMSQNAFAGEYSNTAKIGEIRFNNNAKIIYLKPVSGAWTNTGCMAITVPSSMSGQDGFISIALAAKLAGKEINFFGDCDTVSKNFTAHSIIVL